jgi:nicotinate-nucleotide pyrophosphorylase (carboxylating)
MEIPLYVKKIISLALEEDLGMGDVTSELLIKEDKISMAEIIAKEELILAGMPFVEEVFLQVDKGIKIKTLLREGIKVKKGQRVAKLEGRTRSLLAGERTALNILQHLSGIATLTNKFVREVKGTGAKIVDTRKAKPVLRYMEKYAVRMGGGTNHRFALYDGILIKDNHIEAVGGVKKALELAKGAGHLMKIEIEVKNLEELKEALEGQADVIMLDNMSIKEMREAVKITKKKALLEASGGVRLENARAIAETGVDLISVGAITHSARAVDLSMEIIK